MRARFFKNAFSVARPVAALLVSVVGMFGSTDAWAAASNLLINGSTSLNNINGTIGYRFSASDVTTYTLTGLGFIDADSDGLAASHQVGLYHWNGSAYTLARSVTIGAGTAYHLNGGYRWYPISDYALTDTGTNAYLLAATVGNGDGDFWGGVGSADFTQIGNSTLNAGYNTTAGSFSSSLLPATWNGSFPGNTFYNAPNATILPVPVPEPSTYAMAIGCVACGGYSMYRRRKRS